MLRVRLVGADGRAVKVTPTGELVVAPAAYNETEFNILAVAGTAYNFYGPRVKKQFIISSIIAYADKDVTGGGANAEVIVFEASSSSSATVDKELLQFALEQNQLFPPAPLNIKVAPGVWINAKTDDDDIHMTILGYYIDEVA